MQKELDMFNDFINQFDLSLEPLMGKVKHTHRVVEFANEIAKSLNLSEEDVNKACICALFHDLGRFPQYSNYHTFHDKDSIDHGDESYNVLIKLNYNDNEVLKAVKYHNKYDLPDDLSKREKTFADITRDADKIDIMFEQANYSYEEDYKILDDIMNYFKEGKLIHNNTGADDCHTITILRELAFLFDINYAKSYEIIKNKGIIDKKVNLIYEATKDNEVFEIKKIIDKRIDEYVR